MSEGLSFESALAALKDGFAIQRMGWSGRNMWLMLQAPTPTSRMTLPYIYMKTADGNYVPWLASQTDLLADDWTVLANGGSI